MYSTHSHKIKTAICCIAATSNQLSDFLFQLDVTGNTPLSVHNRLSQEVTMFLVPTPNIKAAVATAAQRAQTSAITGNPIVPPPRQNEPGLCLFLPTIYPFNPFRHVKLSLRPLRI